MYIIGTVGPFGSGCSYIAKMISQTHNFEYISLSAILRNLFEESKGKKAALRKELQDFGDEIRKSKGSSYLAEKAWEKIKEDTSKNYIIDSIRNPGEVEFLKEQHTDFYLFGIFAELDIR